MPLSRTTNAKTQTIKGKGLKEYNLNYEEKLDLVKESESARKELQVGKRGYQKNTFTGTISIGEKEEEEEPAKTEAVRAELIEAYSVIKFLRGKLNEVNLLNAKLLFVNKLFKKANLSESQKVKIIETFDRDIS